MELPGLLLLGIIGGTVALLLLLAYKKIRRSVPASVNCWFCQTDSKVPYSLKDNWTCSFCSQYNGFSKDGGYNKRIPAQWIQSLNHPIMGRPDGGEPRFRPSGLCTQCNSNQELKVFQLASFVPTSEAEFDQQIGEFARRLEEIYELCNKCQEVVRRTLTKEKEGDGADLLIEKLKISAAPLLLDNILIRPPPTPSPPPVFSPLRPYNSTSQLYSPMRTNSSSQLYTPMKNPQFWPSPSSNYPLRRSEFCFRPSLGHYSSYSSLRPFPQTFYSSSEYEYPVNYYKSSSVASIFGGRNKNYISPPRLSSCSDYYAPKLLSRSSSQSSGFISHLDGQSLFSEPVRPRDFSDDEDEDDKSDVTVRTARTTEKKKEMNPVQETKKNEDSSSYRLMYLSLFVNILLLFLLLQNSLLELEISGLLEFVQESIFHFLAPETKYYEEHVLWNLTL